MAPVGTLAHRDADAAVPGAIQVALAQVLLGDDVVCLQLAFTLVVYDAASVSVDDGALPVKR